MLPRSMHARLGGQTAVQSTPPHLTGETTSGIHVLGDAGIYTARVLSHSGLGVRGRQAVSKKDRRTSHSRTHPDGKSTYKVLQLFQALMLWKVLAGRSILYT